MGAAFPTPKPMPPPSSKRVEVVFHGTNSKTTSGARFHVASMSFGFEYMKLSEGTMAIESLVHTLTLTTLSVVTRVLPGMTPSPNPTDPPMSSATLGASAIGAAGAAAGAAAACPTGTATATPVVGMAGAIGAEGGGGADGGVYVTEPGGAKAGTDTSRLAVPSAAN